MNTAQVVETAYAKEIDPVWGESYARVRAIVDGDGIFFATIDLYETDVDGNAEWDYSALTQWQHDETTIYKLDDPSQDILGWFGIDTAIPESEVPKEILAKLDPSK